MIYYQDEAILIREIRETDPTILCQEEIAQGWEATEEKYHLRLKDMAEQRAIAMVAEWQGNVAAEYGSKVIFGGGFAQWLWQCSANVHQAGIRS